VSQSGSQHDKGQVGNMHTYNLDLVHFPNHSIIIQRLIQLSIVPLCYYHCTVPIPIPTSIAIHVPIPVYVPS
jgi:hypothetical protein